MKKLCWKFICILITSVFSDTLALYRNEKGKYDFSHDEKLRKEIYTGIILFVENHILQPKVKNEENIVEEKPEEEIVVKKENYVTSFEMNFKLTIMFLLFVCFQNPTIIIKFVESVL